MSDDRNVITFPGDSSRPAQISPRANVISARAVIEGALEHAEDLEIVVIAGLRSDGSLFGATTAAHTADTLLMIDRLRHRLMRDFDDDTLGGGEE